MTTRRSINRLSTRSVSTLSAPGRHADGGNLYLVVDPAGAKRWTFLYRERGTSHLRETGLGSLLNVSLADAREKAVEYRRLIGQGRDPKAEKIAAAARSRLFGEVTDEYVEKHVAGGSSSPTTTTFRIHGADMRLPGIKAS